MAGLYLSDFTCSPHTMELYLPTHAHLSPSVFTQHSMHLLQAVAMAMRQHVPAVPWGGRERAMAAAEIEVRTQGKTA